MSALRDIIDVVKDIANHEDADFLKNKPKGSLTRMTKDAVLQFPVITSRSIDISLAQLVVKSLERNFGSLLKIAFSLNAITTERDLTNYIRQFHQNTGISDREGVTNVMIDKALKESEIVYDVRGNLTESEMVMIRGALVKDNHRLLREYLSELNLDKLNDKYNFSEAREVHNRRFPTSGSIPSDYLDPPKRRNRDIGTQEDLDKIATNYSTVVEPGEQAEDYIAAGGKSDPRYRMNGDGTINDGSGRPYRPAQTFGKMGMSGERQTQSGGGGSVPPTGGNGRGSSTASPEPNSGKGLIPGRRTSSTAHALGIATTSGGVPIKPGDIGGPLPDRKNGEVPPNGGGGNGSGTVDKSKESKAVEVQYLKPAQIKVPTTGRMFTDSDVKKSNEIMPLAITVGVYIVNKDGGHEIYQEFIIGVKGVIHPVASDYMIDSMVDGYGRNKTFFNFIKATTGEISFFKDFVFMVDKLKKDALDSASKNNKWFSMLKRRSIMAKAKRLLRMKSQLLPNTSIMLSMDEVEAIKAKGVDLMNPSVSKTIIDHYLLLAIVVVNEGLETVDILYDGENNFNTYSFSALTKDAKEDSATKQILNLIKSRPQQF